MSSPDSEPPQGDARAYERVSHGYAPGSRPVAPPPVPLDKIVGDVVDNLSATAKAELALLECVVAAQASGFARGRRRSSARARRS